ncbi:hypothetical protein [Pyrococcus kukulkanii]|uniref:hypothetical protein n=1 Tax=Pyrococcus kukulkanii TaxID=1609559 RepID=UPI003566B959
MHAKRFMSLLFPFLLIFTGIYLEWDTLTKSGWMLGLIVSETALFSMFLLFIGGNKRLPNDTDFVAIIVFAMPTLPLMLGDGLRGIVAGIMIIAGLFIFYKRIQIKLQKSNSMLKSALILALILSGGYIVLEEGMKPLISALFVISAIVVIAIIVAYLQGLLGNLHEG